MSFITKWYVLFHPPLLAFLACGVCLAAPGRAEGAAAEPPVGGERPGEAVLIGLGITRLDEVNDAAKTFAAEFDLWLRYRGEFKPTDLRFPDATKPISLDHPDEATDEGDEHYRLFHLASTFRFKVDRRDVGRRVRKLVIQLYRSAPSTDPSPILPDLEGMGLDAAGADWAVGLRGDGVLPEDAEWELQSAEFRGGPTGGQIRVGRRLYPGVVAAVTVRMVTVSPRSVVAALLPRRAAADLAPWALMTAVLLLAGTWSRPAGRLDRRWVLLLRLLLITLGLYLAEALTTRAAMERLTSNGCRRLGIAFDSLWWLVPAAWVTALLPSLVWEPIGRRTGHPVPSITRLLVGCVAYAVAILMAMNFVAGEPLSNLWAASGVMGIVLGLALQSLILDAFAGLLLNIERPFKILQWVRLEGADVGNQVGQVLEMNWRTTRLWTRENDIVSIPNSSVSKAKITNFALPTAASRLQFEIVLDYAIPPTRARELLRRGALRAVETGRMMADPKPDVDVVASEEGGIRYRVRFYANVNLVSESSALADAVDGVMSVLAEEGVDLSTPPQRVLFSHEGGAGLWGPAGDGAGPPAPTPTNATMPVMRSPAPHPPAAETRAAVRSPLTPEQIRLIQQSWSQITPVADEVARQFYDRLFQLDPGLRPMFRTDPAAQRSKLIGVLSMVVRGIGDLDRILGTVQELGMRHVNYGVRDGHYETVGAALLWSLGRNLGEGWTAECRDAWAAAYGVLASAMKSAAQIPGTPDPESRNGKAVTASKA